MSFLLDTNVVSEWVKLRPDPGVVMWLANADEDGVFISVVTLAELRHGIQRMPNGARRSRLNTWLAEELPARFDARLLAIDPPTADRWGHIMAIGHSRGRPVGTMDAFLAATALSRDLTLVTRNVADFVHLDVRLINPWRDG